MVSHSLSLVSVIGLLGVVGYAAAMVTLLRKAGFGWGLASTGLLPLVVHYVQPVVLRSIMMNGPAGGDDTTIILASQGLNMIGTFLPLLVLLVLRWPVVRNRAKTWGES